MLYDEDEGVIGLKIVLFDGDCHFCNRSVQFIIKRDKKKVFKFASLQSAIGQQLLRDYAISQQTDSFVLIAGNKGYVKSSAALTVCRDLAWPWKLCSAFLVIPTCLRDLFYDLIAKNRHRLGKKGTHCTIPTAEERQRFL